MKRSLVAIWIGGLSAIACGGSNALSPGASRIIEEGNESVLTDCKFMQKVQGKASESDSNAEAHAKNDAKENAAKLGATHIRWIVPCCSYVEAEAYRCDVPD